MRTRPATAIPPKMRDRIGKIEVETGHLVQMVSEIMDLSRIESGTGLTLDRRPRPGQLATASVERLRLFADRQGVSLSVDVPVVCPHPWRRGAPWAGVRQPGPQRGQVQPERKRGGRFGPSPGRGSRGVRAGPRDRDPTGGPAADFRTVLQGRPGTSTRGNPGGNRARPVDRAARRRATRRPHLGRVEGRAGVDLLVCTPARPGGG